MTEAIPFETVLVVDDDSAVVNMVSTILQRHNYKVLRAEGPNEALRIGEEYAGAIHLLLSDVAMLAMSGCQLANRIQERRPQTRVMFMSGHDDGTLLLLNYGWSFVRQPFFTKALLEGVNETLHNSIRSQGTDHFDTRK